MEVTHIYSDITVQLHISCPDCGGLSEKLEHNDIRWITLKEITEYDLALRMPSYWKKFR